MIERPVLNIGTGLHASPREGEACYEGGSVALSNVQTNSRQLVDIMVFFNYVSGALQGRVYDKLQNEVSSCNSQQSGAAAFDLSAAALCISQLYPRRHLRMRRVAVVPGCQSELPPANQIGIAAVYGGVLIDHFNLRSTACITVIMLLPRAL